MVVFTKRFGTLDPHLPIVLRQSSKKTVFLTPSLMMLIGMMLITIMLISMNMMSMVRITMMFTMMMAMTMMVMIGFT